MDRPLAGVLVSKPDGPFKTTMHIKNNMTSYLQYSAHATNANYVGSTNLFELNSQLTPLYTVAHQPYGFDQMAALYSRYLVTGCRIKIETASASTYVGTMVCQVQPPATSLTLNDTSLTDVLERPGTMSWMIGEKSLPTQKEIYVDLAGVVGISKAQYLAEPHNYGALVTADPSSIIKFEVGYASNNTSETVSAIISIQYDVMFFDRKVLAKST